MYKRQVNTDNRLSKAYQEDAQIMSFDAHSYFIATGSNGEPGLYQHSFNSNTATLLAEGIELSLIHISEPTRLRRISYAVFCLKKKITNYYN